MNYIDFKMLLIDLHEYHNRGVLYTITLYDGCGFNGHTRCSINEYYLITENIGYISFMTPVDTAYSFNIRLDETEGITVSGTVEKLIIKYSDGSICSIVAEV
ncbi:hypothetical protein ABGV42_00620 [Paenibacillus pabuli]|uniref:hypothetical protein n=1 Tax=Paenibacillus pabuli TaxID=1472 RepID=UPI003241D99C